MQSLALKKGFTLTEILVVGLLAALLGVGVVGLLRWVFGDSQEDQKRAHLQSKANIVLEEIGRRVHVSSQVSTPASHQLDFVTGGVPSGSISFSGDTLKENGVPFIIGGSAVLLKSDSSYFQADSTGNFVTTQLVLRHDNARFILHTGILRCRN